MLGVTKGYLRTEPEPTTHIHVSAAAIEAACTSSKLCFTTLDQECRDTLSDLDKEILFRDSQLAEMRYLLIAHDKREQAFTRDGESPANSGEVAATMAAKLGIETERFDPREDADLVREMRMGRDLKEDAGGVASDQDWIQPTEVVCAPVMVMAMKTYSGRELLSKGNAYFTPVSGEATARLWEKRLHRGPAIMKRVFTTDAVKGVRVKGRMEYGAACDACARGKAHRRVFPPSTHPAKEPGDRLGMDVIGPTQVVGINGERYIVNIVDKYSGYTYAEAVNLKSDVTGVVIKLVKYADRTHRVKAVMWDGGSEFENADMAAAMAAMGIPILRNAPYTPQEMSLAERNGKQIVTPCPPH